MRRLAIIPARGGSKRIPRKNVKKFLGRPIIAYSIEAALQSGLFDEIIVSTNDEEIAKIATKYGANVPFMRSEENASDHATTTDVMMEVLEYYKNRGISFRYACCIYPTAPFISSFKLTTAYYKMKREHLDCVFPIVPFNYPIQRGLSLENGKVRMINEQHTKTRTQDLEIAYHDSGQFYWFDVKQAMAKKALLTDNTGAIILNEMDCHDIDTDDDWNVAEFKYFLNLKHDEDESETKSFLQSRRA